MKFNTNSYRDHFPTLQKALRWFRHPLGPPERRRVNRWRLSSRIIHESIAIKQRSLLQILAMANRDGLDTAQWVANLAAEHHGPYRRRLLRLARRLQAGTALVDALEQTPDVLSDEMVLAIRFGSQSGTLSASLQRLLSSPVRDSEVSYPTVQHSFFYLTGMVALFCIVISFMSFKIIPFFSHIANEFGWEAPQALQNLISASRFLESTFLLWVVLGFVGLRLITSATMRRFYRRVWAARLLRRVVRLRSAELLNLLSPAVAAGRPLGAALSTLARHHYDRNIRARLLFARNEVEQGAEPWSALSSAGLLSVDESQALVASTCNGTRAWLMHRLADRHQQQYGRRVALLLSLLQPAIVLALAGIVVWIGFAFFGFLGGIIGALA